MSREAMADELASIAANYGLDEGGKWTGPRVSQTILNKKPIPLDDAAALILFARKHKVAEMTWDWLTFGKQRPVTLSSGDQGEPPTGTKTGLKPYPIRPVTTDLPARKRRGQGK